MSTTRKRDRIIALSMAVFFFVLASALTIAVIYQAVTTKNNNQTSNSATTSQTPQTTLQGTQMKDFTPVSSVPALKTTDIKAGTGAVVKAGDKITVDYTGAIASTGIIFQSSLDSKQSVAVTLESGPQGVIEGWVKGIPGMKVGGTRQLLIPASEAYGANPPSGIPANAALVFDVTVDKID